MRPGFTLLETLIALVIASIVAIVTLEMVYGLTRHAASLEAAMAEASDATLATLPMRRAVEGVVPSYADEPGAFAGERRRIAANTRHSAFSASGRPIGFTLEIQESDHGDMLVYSEGGAAYFQRPLTGRSHVFRFVDRAGRIHAEWPPQDGFLEDPVYYIPSPLFILVFQGDETAPSAAYAPTQTRRPPIRSRDVDDLI